MTISRRLSIGDICDQFLPVHCDTYVALSRVAVALCSLENLEVAAVNRSCLSPSTDEIIPRGSYSARDPPGLLGVARTPQSIESGTIYSILIALNMGLSLLPYNTLFRVHDPSVTMILIRIWTHPP
ncbi:hypothetical protein NEOLEDRAFT_1128385 [Neolentinus lepideus HHB14362 ss-1]|uniref:Uncharacterized protein n=1 Tax=Neolentinus lepideus HHB14362 ss-1 TaxID=1314782 RepID=A0A165VF42_9AGAM|nr:hypothetical protein NEOLEDRAFT_1128385 [Neolentinus lepideus HHB14362 ss-1]